MCGIRESLNRWGVSPVAPQNAVPLILREQDPVSWLAQWAGALLAGQSVLLASPTLAGDEWETIKRQWAESVFPEPSVLVATGGTTGRLRWARHTWATLTASSEGFLRFFGQEAGNGVCVLPLHHVGGLMTVVRAVVSGGNVVFGDYREIGRSLYIPPGTTLSLVPTQLGRLLEDSEAVAGLRRAGRILLGGARASETLVEAARSHELPVSPCYGMTETAALIAALRPECFLAGAVGVGKPLSHVALQWSEPVGSVDDLPPAARRLGVRSAAVCQGYWPETRDFQRDPFWTSDAASLDYRGNLHIHGRLDRTIISGGENVDAARVERVLQQFPAIGAAVVLGVPDPDWGERVVAAVETAQRLDEQALKAWVAAHLAAYERPKQVLICPATTGFPRTDMGKIDAKRLAAAFAQQSSFLLPFS